jgi:hypothetical protein
MEIRTRIRLKPKGEPRTKLHKRRASKFPSEERWILSDPEMARLVRNRRVWEASLAGQLRRLVGE